MHSMYEGTLLQAELLSFSCVVEVVVVHFLQLYFVNALSNEQASNAFESF